MITLEEPQTTLLIHVSSEPIAAIREEVNRRVEHLKQIAAHGLSPEEIRTATSSMFAAEQHIENLLLKSNAEYARLVRAGINLSVTLPANLQSLKQLLLDWVKTQNKYQYLDDTSFNVDESALEQAFIRLGHKLYVTQEGVEAIEELQPTLKLFEKARVPSHQAFLVTYLSDRITCDNREACNQLPRQQYMISRRYMRAFIA